MADATGEAATDLRERLSGLYARHGDELRRFVTGVLRDRGGAEDVVQTTLGKALERGGGVRPEALKGWLFRVAYHEALAARRHDQAGGRARLKLAASAGGEPPQADARLARDEAVAAVREALGRLPDDQRAVVLDRVHGGRAFAEIAAERGLPLGTVLTRMRLALAKLRVALEPHQPGPGPGDGR